MKRIVVFIGFATLWVMPSAAAAGPMVSFLDQCVPFFAVSNAPPGVDPVSLVSPSISSCGGVTNALTYSLDNGAVNVQVGGRYEGIQALGFNIAGPRDGLTISNLTAGYRIGDTDVPGTFGFFQYFIYGSNQVYDGRPLEFTLTRDAGFLSPLEVFDADVNENGWLAGTLMSLPGGYYKFASEVEPGALSPVPEPGSMLLLGTGLVAAWRGRRRA